MPDLLDAVDALTLPTREKFKQPKTDDNGKPYIEVTWVTTLPMLAQLDAAIRASVGGTTRGASLAFERNMLDADALTRFVQISSQIRDWCRMAGVARTGDACRDLRAWYVTTMGSHPLSPESEEAHTARLRAWLGYIRGKLDPARERELPDACPACGASEWWRDGSKYYHPLVVRYRPHGADVIQKARAVCRACAQVWGVRELAYELEAVQGSTGVD